MMTGEMHSGLGTSRDPPTTPMHVTKIANSRKASPADGPEKMYKGSRSSFEVHCSCQATAISGLVLEKKPESDSCGHIPVVPTRSSQTVKIWLSCRVEISI